MIGQSKMNKMFLDMAPNEMLLDVSLSLICTFSLWSLHR